MADENFFGVGLNNFGHKINDPYPYGADIPLEISRDPTKRGLVETAYLMIAAEAGWVTLGVFFSMLLYFYFRNIRNIFKLKNHSARYIAIALLGALTQVYIQTTLEWVINQPKNIYQLMLVFALIATISRIVESRKGKDQTNTHVSAAAKQTIGQFQKKPEKPPISSAAQPMTKKQPIKYKEVPCVSNI